MSTSIFGLYPLITRSYLNSQFFYLRLSSFKHSTCQRDKNGHISSLYFTNETCIKYLNLHSFWPAVRTNSIRLCISWSFLFLFFMDCTDSAPFCVVCITLQVGGISGLQREMERERSPQLDKRIESVGGGAPRVELTSSDQVNSGRCHQQNKLLDSPTKRRLVSLTLCLFLSLCIIVSHRIGQQLAS